METIQHQIHIFPFFPVSSLVYLVCYVQNPAVAPAKLYRHEHELLRELAEVDGALDDYDRRAEV